MLTRRTLLKWAPSPLLPAACMQTQGLAQAQVPLSVIEPDLGPPVPLRMPQEHGAHLAYETEWWSLKGEINQAGEPELGFHMTFFRARVASAEHNPSKFAPKHVIGARASLSDAKGMLLHDQRMARVGFGLVDVSEDDMNIKLLDWTFSRSGPLAQSVFKAHIVAPDFSLDLRAIQSQDMMLHGEKGFIRRERTLLDSSRYYSQPYLKLDGQVGYKGRKLAATGRAWMDHGWGRSQLALGAAGTDWIGMHLNDGSALMVFRMRREDGLSVWESASLRQPGKPDRVFKHEEISLTPGDFWRSPATGAKYPVTWRMALAGTVYMVRARVHEQEMDGSHGVGDVFWEGLSDLLDTNGRVMGSGYLEMSGYVPEPGP
ncbi:MAG: lipocalin-like domain-containing protein [Polaromonas sp.]|nr:lipocalin-like domain-containing protein [Polaromonas sp.]